MIRPFESQDIPRAKAIHAESGLPENCFPDLLTPDGVPNALYIVKGVYEVESNAALMVFLKISSEIYLLVDHKVGTPEQRMAWLEEMRDWLNQKAWENGLDQMTAWIPTDIEKSFGKRLLELGFERSPWTAYTLNVR